MPSARWKTGLLADLVQPLGRGSTTKRPGVVEDPRAEELGDRVDEPGAAEPLRLDVADHRQLHLAVADLHTFDRAVRGAHPAADLGGLERRPRGRGAGRAREAEEPSTISEFVPTSMNSRTRRSSVRPVARIPATMSGPTYAPRAGRGRPAPARGRRGPKSLAAASGRRSRGDRERRHRQRLGVDAERELDHRHVAGDDDLVHLGRLDARLGGTPRRSASAASRARAPAAARAPSSIIGRGDARDDVGAEGLLRVQDRPHRRAAGPSRGRAGSRRRSSSRGRRRSRACV